MIFTQTGLRTSGLKKTDLSDDNNPLDNLLSLQQTVPPYVFTTPENKSNFKETKGLYFLSGGMKEVDGKYTRSKDNFIYKDMIVLDFDDGNFTLEELAEKASKYDCLIYPTISHTPDQPRCRACFAIDKTITDEETYLYNAELIAKELGHTYDPASNVIVQLMGVPLSIDPQPIRINGDQWRVLDPADENIANLKPDITYAKRLDNGEIIQEKERNNALHSKACSLRRQGYKEPQILNNLIYLNDTQISPPLELKELKDIAKSASKHKPQLEQDLADLNLYDDVERIEEPSDHGHVISTERRQLFLPDVKFAQNGTQTYKATITNMESILEWLNISVYYDVILKRTFIKTNENTPKGVLYSTRNLNILTTYILSLCEKIDFKISDKKIFDYLINIAHKNRRNVPLEKLKEAYKKYPDNTDEINKMLDCFTFIDMENEEHHKQAIKKWLSQVVAMICNEHGIYGAEFSLVLQGRQGIGKTTFGNVLCNFFGQEYFKEGIMLSDDKDSVIKNTSCVIGEIGELSKSLRDINFLKNFITSKDDNFRKPYSREDEIYPRNSCYYMTTNDVEFLRDTENRRFYVVEIANIDLKKFNELNFAAIWAEAYDNWLIHGQQSFRPTKEEQRINEEIASKYRDRSKEERLIKEIYDWQQPIEEWEDSNATSIADTLTTESHMTIDPRQVGKALRAFGYELKHERYTKKIIQGIAFYRIPTKLNGNCYRIGNQRKV